MVVSGGPIYLRALEKIGVTDAVVGMGAYNKNVTVNSSWVPLEALAANEATAAVDELADEHLGGYYDSSSFRIKSRGHFWNVIDKQPLTGPLSSRAYFQTMTGIESQVTYIEGVHPSNKIDIAPDGTRTVEAAINYARVTRKHGEEEITLHVGDVLHAVSEPRGIGTINVKITGIFKATDERSPFWLGYPTAILTPSPPIEFGGRDLPLILHVNWDVMTEGVAPANAGLPADFNWVYFTNAEKLSEARASDMLERITQLEDDVAKKIVRPSVITTIDPTFQRLEEKITFVRIPMFLLAALTIVIVAYYLFLVSGLLSTRRGPETVMLRSRGLSVMQILRFEALEGLMLIGLPVLVAPLVAAAAVWAMGMLPVFDQVTNGEPLSVELTWKAWAYSAGTGIAALIVILGPVLLAALSGVVADRASKSRPDTPPLFQRYYLDALFLVLGGLVWWELNSRGSVISASRDGGRSADSTLLFAPAIFLIVVALLFLRVFPLVARIVSIIAGRSGSASISMGFWRLGRRPYWYSWPVILLVLAGGLGVLAGTLASTLERSSREQILYETGGDLHVTPSGINNSVTPADIAEVENIDGVNLASLALRTTATLGTTSSGPNFELLAVEAIKFPQIGWFREDFAEQDVATLLKRIDVPVKPEPIFLPAGTEQLTLWGKQDPFVTDHFLWLILRGSNGRTATATLGQISGEWNMQSVKMPEILTEPVEIISIQTFMQAGGDGGTPTTISLDDLVAISPEFEETVISFDDAGLWTGLPTSNGLDTVYSIAPEDPGTGQPGTNVGVIAMDRGTNSGIRGIYRTATGGPLPVIASDSFLQQTNSQVNVPFVANIGGGFVPVVVVDSLHYFPTLDAERDPFVVADINSMLAFIELRGLRSLGANEMFVSIDPAMHVEIKNQVRDIFRSGMIIDREELLNNTTIDPLAVAGWRGMGVVALILTGIATVLGYITYLSAHSRSTEHDSAYMQAIGLSRGEFMRIVMIEHGLIGLIGIVLGVVTGVGISRIAMQSMAFTETGDRLLPPFILQINWFPVGIILGIATITTALVLLALLRAYPRLPLHVLTRTRE
jgi:ABC-type lipoprotein release transport system permease subunit